MATSNAAAPWKQLVLKSLESNSHIKSSSFFQLATIGSNGRPANRTVVFRGFQDDSDRILINTDSRTHKVEDLKHCPFAEICWYFTDSWEQFRINGPVEIIDESSSDPFKLHQREKSWFASSLKSRLQYLGPYPGLPSVGDDPPSNLTLDPSAPPVDAFCLLVLDPDQVDYLNLKSNTRLAFTAFSNESGEKKWISERIQRQKIAFRTSAVRGKSYPTLPHPKRMFLSRVERLYVGFVMDGTSLSLQMLSSSSMKNILPK